MTMYVAELVVGPLSILTPDEELALEDWLVEMAKIGYGRSRQQLQ